MNVRKVYIKRSLLILCLTFASTFVRAWPGDATYDENFAEEKCSGEGICVGEEVLDAFFGFRATVVNILEKEKFSVKYIDGQWAGQTWVSEHVASLTGNLSTQYMQNKLGNPTQISWDQKPKIEIGHQCGQIGTGWKGIVCAICAKEKDTLDIRIVRPHSVVFNSDWYMSTDVKHLKFDILDGDALESIRCQSKTGKIFLDPELRVQDALMQILKKAGGFVITQPGTKEI